MSIPSRNVTFTKPAEPSFLKAFKSKVGYKEPVGLDAKRPVPAPPPGGDEDGDGVEREDELPTVVVLRQGDVGEEEFLEDRQKKIKEVASKKSSNEATPTVGPRPEGEEEDDGKIKFKKPTKRSSSENKSGVLDASSSKRSKQDAKESAATIVVGGVTRRRRSSEGESRSRKVKNSSLLSFGDDEED